MPVGAQMAFKTAKALVKRHWKAMKVAWKSQKQVAAQNICLRQAKGYLQSLILLDLETPEDLK